MKPKREFPYYVRKHPPDTPERWEAEGRYAAEQGKPCSANPYKTGSDEGAAWAEGYSKTLLAAEDRAALAKSRGETS